MKSTTEAYFVIAFLANPVCLGPWVGCVAFSAAAIGASICRMSILIDAVLDGRTRGYHHKMAHHAFRHYNLIYIFLNA